MEEKNNERRNLWLHVRLTKAELDTIQKHFGRTTEKRLSAYIRKIILKEPLTKGVRNLSADALIPLLAQLLKDLNGAGNNYNQAVHKLHTLRSQNQYQRWLITHEADRQRLLENIARIKDFIIENGRQWLQ